MHVAITGVSGFIGSYIAKHLKAAGHTITGLVRPTSNREHLHDTVDQLVIGDQADESCWDKLISDSDCVIHNSVDWEPFRNKLDLNLHLQKNLVSSIKFLHAAAPRQFIFISSVAVHHDILPRWNHIIEEDHPLRPSSIYGAYKAAVEAHMWHLHFDTGMSTTAIRPCAVYGLDPKLERSIGYPIIQELNHYKAYKKTGGGKFVHVDDVAAVVAACVGNNQAVAGKSYTLADCYARWADWAVICAELLGITEIADIDLSSPHQSKNVFSKTAPQSLGIPVNRSYDGITKHLAQLIEIFKNNNNTQ